MNKINLENQVKNVIESITQLMKEQEKLVESSKGKWTLNDLLSEIKERIELTLEKSDNENKTLIHILTFFGTVSTLGDSVEDN